MSKLRDFSKIDIKYKEYKNNEESIKRLYENVKQEYRSDKNLDIVLERAFLSNQKEKYKGVNMSLVISLVTIVFSVFLSVLINQIIKNMNILHCVFLGIFFAGTTIFMIIFAYRGDIFYERNEHIYFDIRLAALDEIERERENSTK